MEEKVTLVASLVCMLIAFCVAPSQGNGFHSIVVTNPANGLTFATQFTEGLSNPIPIVEVHRASVTSQLSSHICALNITLESSNAFSLDSVDLEILFPTDARPAGFGIATDGQYIEYFNATSADSITNAMWTAVLQNLKYWNIAPEPSLADRRVAFRTIYCNGFVETPVYTTIAVDRVNDIPPLINLNLAVPSPVLLLRPPTTMAPTTTMAPPTTVAPPTTNIPRG